MCGIFLYLRRKNLDSFGKEKIEESFNKVKHRGPDFTSYNHLQIDDFDLTLGFHRLAIVDLSVNGNQPFVYKEENRTIYVLCNGEIYNHKKLREEHKLELNSDSDCAVIGPLYMKYGIKKTAELLETQFAFVIVDVSGEQEKEIKIFACRDRFGIRPLYYSVNKDELILCSELKGMTDIYKEEIFEFPSSKILKWDESNVKLDPYYSYDYPLVENKTDRKVILSNIRNLLVESVKRQLMSDVPIAFLLSGGIDSSLICGIASKLLTTPIRTFTIGMEGGTDIKYAEEVAKYINSNHTTFIISKEEALSTIESVVYCEETYDTTTIRAGVFQRLISQKISQIKDDKGNKYKVIFCGEGSDEIFQGYKEFHNAPSAKESREHSIKRIKEIYLYDGKRCDRCISNFGMEARVPFLDHHLVDYVMSLDPELICPKNNGGIEKKILRDSFSSKYTEEKQKFVDVIPDSILYRKKEALSDGCSSLEDSWYMILQNHIEKIYPFEKIKLENEEKKEHLSPTTKEQTYYRTIYEKFFGKQNVKIVPEFWLHKWSNSNDPSARTVTQIST